MFLTVLKGCRDSQWECKQIPYSPVIDNITDSFNSINPLNSKLIRPLLFLQLCSLHLNYSSIRLHNHGYLHGYLHGY